MAKTSTPIKNPNPKRALAPPLHLAPPLQRAKPTLKRRPPPRANLPDTLLTNNPMQSAGFHLPIHWGGIILLTITASALIGALMMNELGLLIRVFFIAFGALFIPALLCQRGKGAAVQTRPLDRVPAHLPRLALLIPLYRERAVLEQMSASLRQIHYPRQKLEALLLIEADDRETLAGIERVAWPDFVKCIIVPPGSPRTKPRALNYGLNQTTADIIGVLDAEDQVHPDQLLEAAQQFLNHDHNLAAVQAPLMIAPQSSKPLHHLFAFEYLIQFYFILPMLVLFKMPLPLSGTSNYFRRAALIHVNGWDSYNLTEDADLGIRLYRYGYQISLIKRPTYECAPENWRDWFYQRTRWFTGHIQTLLVHARAPMRILREMGGLRVYGAFVVLSSRLCYGPAHTALLIYFIVDPSMMIHNLSQTLIGHMTLVIYAAMLCCAIKGLLINRNIQAYSVMTFLGLYWVLHIFPLCYAIYHSLRRNFKWYKTPHKAHPLSEG